ncbi:Gfo/Idh/MocA family oxidoreductase [Rugosimonospora acidiphila]|uniref:Gfo/Idh/MocA family oxidoreductase n=1 Tax=Rugosimonospora acidiphila TaxID=556531 RepID=A0ABP9SRF5_9ACTN
MPDRLGRRERVMRVGIVGLGTASTQIIPEIADHPHLELVAGCDVRPAAREQFANRYHRPAYETVERLAAAPDVDAVYVASPNAFHCEHVTTVAAHHKEIIVEKPMALTLAQCDQMIDAARRAGVRLLAGHTHSFDAPILKMAELIESGAIGSVYMLQNLYYTDWLYRGRLPDELDATKGGGTVFRQGPHSVDIIRLLAGRPVRSVRAVTSSVDPRHPTEGGFMALLSFDGGAVATIVFSGYGYFDSSELTFGIGENGDPRPADTHATSRRTIGAFASAEQEAAYKDSMRLGGERAGQWLRSGPPPDPARRRHPFYGLTIVSGTGGDLRQSPNGLVRYDDTGAHEIPVPRASLEREAELDILYEAWRRDAPLPSHDGRWARATLEVLLAIRESSRTGEQIPITSA